MKEVWVRFIVPVRKERHRSWKQLVQGHTSGTWQNQDSSPGLATFGAHIPMTILYWRPRPLGESMQRPGSPSSSCWPRFWILLSSSAPNPSASSSFWEAQSLGNGKDLEKEYSQFIAETPFSVWAQASIGDSRNHKLSSCKPKASFVFCFTEEMKICMPFPVCSRVKHLLVVFKAQDSHLDFFNSLFFTLPSSPLPPGSVSCLSVPLSDFVSHFSDSLFIFAG